MALIMIDKAWRTLTPLTIHNCFKKTGFLTPNLVDVHDTLVEYNAEPPLGKTIPVQDLTFEDSAQVDTDIATLQWRSNIDCCPPQKPLHQLFQNVRPKKCSQYTVTTRRLMSALNSPPAIRNRATTRCSDLDTLPTGTTSFPLIVSATNRFHS
ncbi:hypothetical protein TNCV_960001 [Trichonephila clavipes]|nr:hypothetical protein TNCV_960001 [Trichonephila clavipes]